uniref:Uncharacterized protein n=1 Tax=Nelumbo nucifera TaxID=4432 RepID=A0A822Y682_NELNU|nr:TPA_asm: hypothetical protein HUJ06_029445 [Nelumbo nucifera]
MIFFLCLIADGDGNNFVYFLRN